MSGYEQALLTRTEVLEDAGELVQAITAVLAGAQEAGADPAAVASLQAAVRALDPGVSAGYDAGSKQDRRPGGGYRSDGEFLEAVSDAEGDVQERLQETGQLQEQVTAALDAAQAALDDARQTLAAALAMATKDPCDGCHPAKAAAIAAAEAAIAAAERRISLCDAAADILDALAWRLQSALDRLRQVPEDLGEAYEVVYQFIRKGGKLPIVARWIEGAGAGR
jgi:uncharacterized Ntn-hydrolase superfamily protein